MALTPERQMYVQQRRATVAQLFMARVSQREIAKQLDESDAVISNDVKILQAAWQRAMIDDPVKERLRELAEIDDMERYAALQLVQTRDGIWWDRRLRAKERRARMLGLDAPIKVDKTEKLHITVEEIRRDISNRVDSIAARLGTN